MKPDFSFQTRERNIREFQSETFDFLVIGGGITGAAVARDAASRGLKVALVERQDFSWGTSSRSSKLIHGGLRYLENLEFGLVFEALSERAFLLKTAPHMVKPLKFYFPVYKGDRTGRWMLSLGLWFYDLLALFRAPGSHRHLSRKRLLEEVPFLNPKGLEGGFTYFDASMWDDVLAVETLRAAQKGGARVANYVEALSPLWVENRIRGFRVRDRESGLEIDLRSKRTIVCAGPWTDELGRRLSPHWKGWLNPSKGVHLVFSQKRLPISGALVMGHPQDGRIVFVIPREDLGEGVVIVGTTDGPVGSDKPEQAKVDHNDVDYLMNLLGSYFPELKLTTSDILSAYVGVRPLMGAQAPTSGSEGQGSQSLQKVSREHYIGQGPGGSTLVAGGKYTTHRTMAEEIVDEALKAWREDARRGVEEPAPKVNRPRTRLPLNEKAGTEALAKARAEADGLDRKVPEELFERYGAEALDVLGLHDESQGFVASEGMEPTTPLQDPAGFPYLCAQLRMSIRTGMVLHLEDFYFRRLPLFMAREDHGLPWLKELAKVWAEELGKSELDRRKEVERLEAVIAQEEAWKKTLND